MVCDTHACWLCPESFPTARDLKTHQGSSLHGSLRVMCPLCDNGSTWKGALDLKSHLRKDHPGQLDLDQISEPNCTWFAVKPKDYIRLVILPPLNDAWAIKARELVRRKLRAGTRDCDMRKTLSDWEKGWKEASNGGDMENEGEEESENTLSTPRYDLHNITIDQEKASFIFMVSSHGWEWLELQVSMVVLGLFKDSLIRLLAQVLYKTKEQEPTGERSTVSTIKIAEVLPDLLPVLKMNLQINDVLGMWTWPVNKNSKPTKRKMDDVSVDGAKAIKISLNKRAEYLLSRGGIPLFPAAQRDWKQREMTIKVKDVTIEWPPKGWNTFSPDRKLLMWEHTALTIELLISGKPLERDDLMSKFNFLSLPGSANPSLQPTRMSRLREENYHFLQAVARGEQEHQDTEPALMMLEAAMANRDNCLDFIFDQIDDVQLYFSVDEEDHKEAVSVKLEHL